MAESIPEVVKSSQALLQAVDKAACRARRLTVIVAGLR
jgi:hypothetical protein